ncbi:MAG: hypothetical protein M3119_03340 [Verrucomicrobiota bacterium]|nr:hypothetical protein [Verrucomicrobiota bacterium]
MTDYFALFDQPRQAWLDPEKLKEIYHAKARTASPDAQLNEAYQVLRDAKRRLYHLLTLRGDAPSRENAGVPREIENLFPAVAGLTRETDLLLNKLSQATNALSRSLLKSEITAIQNKIAEVLAIISELKNAALVRLQTVEENDSGQLHALYLQFSYLNRWIEQLEERQLQLRL